MPDTRVIVKAHEDHVLQRTALLHLFRKQRGERKTADGYMIPLTTNHDIAQITAWWNHEYKRSRASLDWYKDSDKQRWARALTRIQRELQGADPDARYASNEWFWNRAILKLSILLQVAKTKPSPTQLMIESFKETIQERAEDADKIARKAGAAVEKVAEVTSGAWSGLKIAAIVGGGLLGTAIVLPPIIRAFRN